MNPYDYHPITHAIHHGDLNRLELMMDRYPDKLNIPDKDRVYPLHLAAQIGSVDMIEAILRRSRELLEHIDSRGFKPLHYAILSRDVVTTERLLQHGAIFTNIIRLDNNVRVIPSVESTPIILAMESPGTQMLDWVLRQIPHWINIRTYLDEAAIHIAAKRYSRDSITQTNVHRNAEYVLSLKAMGAATHPLPNTIGPGFLRLTDQQIEFMCKPLTEEETLRVRHRIYFQAPLTRSLLQALRV